MHCINNYSEWHYMRVLESILNRYMYLAHIEDNATFVWKVNKYRVKWPIKRRIYMSQTRNTYVSHIVKLQWFEHRKLFGVADSISFFDDTRNKYLGIFWGKLQVLIVKGCGLWLWHSLDFSLTFFLLWKCMLCILIRFASYILITYDFIHTIRNIPLFSRRWKGHPKIIPIGLVSWRSD